MKKIIALLLICVGLLLIWNLRRGHQPHYLSEQQVTELPVVQNPTLYETQIKALNDRNASIRSVIYDHIDIKIYETATIHIQGSLAFEKSKKFRMTTRSVAGKETDIGSNDNYFWFWSKRMKPPALYYALHENANKTRLKTPFHPLWMMESLSIGEVDLSNAQVAIQGKYLKVVQPRISISGTSIIKTTLIDPNRWVIVGHYINESGKLIISTEITDFYQIGNYYLPKTVRTIWYDEDVQVDWLLGQPQMNVVINGEAWKMPDMRQKIDMAQ